MVAHTYVHPCIHNAYSINLADSDCDASCIGRVRYRTRPIYGTRPKRDGSRTGRVPNQTLSSLVAARAPLADRFVPIEESVAQI